jgi:hypothetical protein
MKRYPVFVMCGRDPKRRKIMEIHDPQGVYKVKGLLPFLGKRVIDWQLEALRESPHVGDIYLIGLTEEDISFDFPIHYVPVSTISTFVDKLSAGLAYLRSRGVDENLIVVSSSDAPGFRVESVNKFFSQLEKLPGYDFVMSLVPIDITEKVFPDSGRVVARFRDCQVFPGELYAMSVRAIHKGGEIITEFARLRREVDRTARKISLGPLFNYIGKQPRTWPLLIKFALGLAELADGERIFELAFNARGKGVIIPDPGFGMDMDLPEDYLRLEAYLRELKGL